MTDTRTEQRERTGPSRGSGGFPGGQGMGAQPCGQVSCSLAGLEEKRERQTAHMAKWLRKLEGWKARKRARLSFFPGSLHSCFYFAKCTGIKILIRIRVSVWGFKQDSLSLIRGLSLISCSAWHTWFPLVGTAASSPIANVSRGSASLPKVDTSRTRQKLSPAAPTPRAPIPWTIEGHPISPGKDTLSLSFSTSSSLPQWAPPWTLLLPQTI